MSEGEWVSESEEDLRKTCQVEQRDHYVFRNLRAVKSHFYSVDQRDVVDDIAHFGGVYFIPNTMERAIEELRRCAEMNQREESEEKEGLWGKSGLHLARDETSPTTRRI